MTHIIGYCTGYRALRPSCLAGWSHSAWPLQSYEKRKRSFPVSGWKCSHAKAQVSGERAKF